MINSSGKVHYCAEFDQLHKKSQLRTICGADVYNTFAVTNQIQLVSCTVCLKLLSKKGLI